MKQVMCIDNVGKEMELIIGKLYVVQEEGLTSYDLEGVIGAKYKYRFKEVFDLSRVPTEDLVNELQRRALR